MHYGYWLDGLAVEPMNLPKAQAAYTDFLMDAMLSRVRSILDVACGAGHNALRLLERRYQVDCVSPNGYLTRIAKRRLGERAGFFECRIEDLQTDQRYDLVLFSESLLFMPLGLAPGKAPSLLNAGGHILIADIFRLPAEDQSPIGGGPHLTMFEELCMKWCNRCEGSG